MSSPGARFLPSMSKRGDVDVVAPAIPLARDVVGRPDEIICICGSTAVGLRGRQRRLGDVDGKGQRADLGAAARSSSAASSACWVASTTSCRPSLPAITPPRPPPAATADLRVDGLLVDRFDKAGHGIGNRGLIDVEGVRDAVVGAEAQPRCDRLGREREWLLILERAGDLERQRRDRRSCGLRHALRRRRW